MDKKHSLKTVSIKTGLSSFVIRAWEKRHGVVNPGRTETNRRYYNEAEIEKLKLLKKAVDSGHSISSLSPLSYEKLHELVTTEEKRSIFFRKSLLPENLELKIKNMIEEIFNIAGSYNSKKFQLLLSEIEVDFSQSIIIEEFILPILCNLDEMRESDKLEKMTEQFLINELTYYLQQIINKIPASDELPLLVTYSPIGGFLQIGSLITAAVAKTEKWRCYNLGQNYNSLEISSVVNKLKPVAISINMIYPYANPIEMENELIQLKSSIPENTKILLSGRTVWNYKEEVNMIGGIFTGDTFSLRKELNSIKNAVIIDRPGSN